MLLFEALEANLNAQIAQAYTVGDPTYIRQQPAGEMAILHGVMSDKSIHLVEVIASGFAPSSAPAPSSVPELSDAAL